MRASQRDSHPFVPLPLGAAAGEPLVSVPDTRARTRAGGVGGRADDSATMACWLGRGRSLPRRNDGLAPRVEPKATSGRSRTRRQRNYGIRALNSSGLIAMNNAIISPTTNPTTVPAATPRQSTFCSLGVISTSQRHRKPYHILGQLSQYRQSFLPFLMRPALLKSNGRKFKLRHYRRLGRLRHSPKVAPRQPGATISGFQTVPVPAV